MDKIISAYLSEEATMTPCEPWQELCEKSDRTSPEDYPDMCLITQDELREYMRGSFVGGVLQAVETLRHASGKHEAEAAASKKVVESEGNMFAARILRSYANGLEMDAERLT